MQLLEYETTKDWPLVQLVSALILLLYAETATELPS
jgi:hypothetical protein